MQDFVKRMVEEKTVLEQKYYKLRDFLYSEKIENLDKENRLLLHTQFNIMGAYLCVLERRIEINK